MASRWLVNNRGNSLLTFGELVSLARCGDLHQDDLVKAEWEPDWRPAHTVVGLFYRAKRDEIQVASEPELVSQLKTHLAESAFRIDELEAAQELQSADETESLSATEPGWQKRLREVQEARAQDTGFENLPESASSSIQLLIEAAMAPAKVSRWSQRWDRWCSRWSRLHDWLNTTAALRLVSGFVIAVFVGWGLFHYSRQTALRFPRPDMPDRFVLPVFGDCTPGEFLFVLIDMVIVSMFLIYFGGQALERWLESRSRVSQEAG